MKHPQSLRTEKPFKFGTITTQLTLLYLQHKTE